MSIASKLTDEQKEKLGEWADEAIGLSGIQKRVEQEFGFRMTYMDTRFLALDLGLDVKEPGDDEPEEAVEDEVITEEVIQTPEQAAPPLSEDSPLNGPSNVSVSIDELVIPGAVISGKVTFSDGEKATWMIDQMGRFGVEPSTAGYQPNDSDMKSFQSQLSTMMRKKGY